jgi:hypothetical protein
MIQRLDTSDVPAVPADQLAMAMRVMIDSGRGLVLLRGASSDELLALEQAIWHRLDGDLVRRRAVLVRFQHLIEVFSARRLRSLMLRRGYNLIAPALLVASSMRLNTKWGFSAHKFTLALGAVTAELEQRPTHLIVVERTPGLAAA